MKIVVILLLVLLVTIAIGVYLYLYTVPVAEADAEATYQQHAADQATAVELWSTTNAETLSGLSSSAAVASDDTDAIADRFDVVRSDHDDRIHEIHYVDRDTGEILVSTSDDAVGADAFDGDLSEDDLSEHTPTPPHEAVGDDTTVLSYAMESDERSDRLVVLSVPSSSLDALLSGTEEQGVVVASGSTVYAQQGGETNIADQAVGAAGSGDGIEILELDAIEYAVTSSTASGSELSVLLYTPDHVLYDVPARSSSALVMLVYVIAFALALVGITVGGNVALSLRQLVDKAQRMGEGDLDIEMESRRSDEVGSLYEAFDAMRLSLRDSLEETEQARREAEAAQEQIEQRHRELLAEAEHYGDVMAACADGDLTRRIDAETDDEAMAAIAASFNEMLDSLEETVEEVQRFASVVNDTSSAVEASAEEVEDASNDVSVSIQEISEGSHGQTEDLQTAASEISDLSATVEEVAATTTTVAEQSATMAELGDEGKASATEVVEQIEQVEEQTNQVVEAIEILDEQAGRIEEISSFIDDIATQTNILALNATIEAARASHDTDGEGFAVVAQEIQNLSSETQEAVDDIQSTVDAVQEQITETVAEAQETESQLSEGADSVTDLAETLDEIVQWINSVDERVRGIDDATNDQARSTEDITVIVDEVASVSAETTTQAEEVAAAAEEATATINEVSTIVQELDDQARDLTDVVETFTVSADVDDALAPTTGGDD